MADLKSAAKSDGYKRTLFVDQKRYLHSEAVHYITYIIVAQNVCVLGKTILQAAKLRYRF